MDLVFDGSNVQAFDPLGIFDYSVLPTSLCSCLLKSNSSLYCQPSQNFGQNCLSLDYDTPKGRSSNYKCIDNQGLKLNNQIESSLRCQRSYDLSDYFFQNSNGVYTKRQRTLFNIYAFASYYSSTSTSPSLLIKNCEFQYFLNGLDSLINIEQGSLSLAQQNEKSFYFFNGRMTGGNITLNQVTASYSQFCRGMIFSRKLTTDVTYSMSLVNYTLLYSSNLPFETLYYDSIVILNSNFTYMNAFTSVKALATQDDFTQFTFLADSSYQPFPVINPIDVGIVLNLQDFRGSVVIQQSSFDRNMHYISEANNTIYFDSEIQPLENFRQGFRNLQSEYKLGICISEFYQSYYLFGHSNLLDGDSEDLFDSFERLSMIFISRPRAPMIINNSTFTNNIGTFGGAVTIDTPIWDLNSNLPTSITISNNIFNNNMAYLSGNAVYIRLGIISDDYSSMCGNGICIQNNYFQQNIGTKVQNGGAVSVVCKYFSPTDVTKIGSGVNPTLSAQWSNYQLTDNSVFGVTRGLLSTYTVNTGSLQIANNYFQNNYAGQKGSALYLFQISQVISISNIVKLNSAVYSYFEILYSPYTLYLSSGVPFTFYDPFHGFEDEYDFMKVKGYNNSAASIYNQMENTPLYMYNLQYPMLQGALHVAYVASDASYQNRIQSFTDTGSVFEQNDVGVLLNDNFSPDLASCFYGQNGISINFQQTNFQYNQQPQRLINSNLMPSNMQYYFKMMTQYVQCSMIVLISQSENKHISKTINQLYQFNSVIFLQNFNWQFFDFTTNTTTQYYRGGLIRLVADYIEYSKTNLVVILVLEKSRIGQNVFYGQEASLFYLEQGFLKSEDCQYVQNGALLDEVRSQEYGIFYLQSNAKYNLLADYHYFHQNIYAFNFAVKSVVFFFRVSYQHIVISGEYYVDLFSIEQGIVIRMQDDYYPESNNYITMDTCQIERTFGGTVIYIENILFPIIKNPSFIQIGDNNIFINCFSSQSATIASVGQLISLFFKESSVLYYNSHDDAFPHKPTDVIVEADFNEAYLQDLFCNDLRTNINQQNCVYKIYINFTYFLQDYDKTSSKPCFYFKDMGLDIDTNQVNQDTSAYLYPITSQLYEFAKNDGWLIRYFEWGQAIFAVNYFQIVTDNGFTMVEQYNSKVAFTEYGSLITLIYSDLIKGQAFFNVQQQSELVIFDESFQYPYAYEGTYFIYIENSNLTLDAVFFRNMSFVEPLIFIAEDTVFNCYFTFFIYNVVQNGLVLTRNVNSKQNQQIFFNGGYISQNFASEYVLLFQNAVVNFIDFSLDGRILENFSPAFMVLQQSTVTFVGYSFLSQQITDAQASNYNISNINYQGQIQANLNSVVNFTNCLIIGAEGSQSALVLAQTNSSVFMQGTTVLGCNANQVNAGVFTLINSQISSIVNSSFSNNIGIIVYMENSNLIVSDTNFSYGQQQYIRAERNSSMYIKDSYFYLLADGSTSTQGGAIYCWCTKITIENCLFKSLTSQQGGAIYLNQYSQGTFNIMKSQFIESEASQGGAIFIQSAANLLITDCIFIGNKANIDSGQGGALYVMCYNFKQNATFNGNCKFQILKNTFYYNVASLQGGAVMWATNETFELKHNQVKNNYALYGQDIASYPKKLNAVMTQNGVATLIENVNSTSSIGTYEIQDTEALSVEILLIDQYNQIVASDSTSTALIYPNSTQNTTVTLSYNKITADKGVFNFSSVYFLIQPGTNTSLILQFFVPNTYQDQNWSLPQSTMITIEARSCNKGEGVVDGLCQICQPGYYSLTPNSTTTECLVCPLQALCFGGDQIAPNAGYQHSQLAGDLFIQCPIATNCLKGSPNQLNGSCSEGYYGVVCATCSSGYYESNTYLCTQCPSAAVSVTMVLIYLLQGILVAWVLYITGYSDHPNLKTTMSMLIKLIVNHIQTMSLLIMIDFEWPDSIYWYFKSPVSLLSYSDILRSLECFFPTNVNGLEVPSFFWSRAILLFLPLLQLLMLSILYKVVTMVRRLPILDLRSKLYSFVVILVFVGLPDQTRLVFQSFNCISIDSELRFVHNMEQLCYTGMHQTFIMTIVLPFIIFWFIGIAIAAGVLIKRYWTIRNGIMNEDFQVEEKSLAYWKSLWYIFNSYRLDYFYWEFVILARKLLIQTTQIVYQTQYPQHQILLLALSLILNMVLQGYFKPFQKSLLNFLEIISLASIATTLYIELLYLSFEDFLQISYPLECVMMTLLVLPTLFFLGFFTVHLRRELLKELFIRKQYQLIKVLACRKYNEKTFYNIFLKNDNAFRWSDIYNEVEVLYWGVLMHQKEKNLKTRRVYFKRKEVVIEVKKQMRGKKLSEIRSKTAVPRTHSDLVKMFLNKGVPEPKKPSVRRKKPQLEGQLTQLN